MKKIIKFIMLVMVMVVGVFGLVGCGPQKKKTVVPLFVQVNAERYEDTPEGIWSKEMTPQNLKNYVYFTKDRDVNSEKVKVENFEIIFDSGYYHLSDGTTTELRKIKSLEEFWQAIEKYENRFEMDGQIIIKASFKPFTVETETEKVTYVMHEGFNEQRFWLFYTNIKPENKKS